MADIERRPGGGDLSTRLEPKVDSLARPTVEGLLQARADIQREDSLKSLFVEAKEQGHSAEWLSDNLAPRLAGLWGSDFAGALEASRYLADEFFQLGDEDIFLISTETGKILCKLDGSDIYQPAPVPRESGNLAQPLPRIRPELEGAIATWVFEKGRDEQLDAILKGRVHQTALLREDGDRRLLVATREGRARLSGAVAHDNPKALLERAGGTAGAFLKHFDLYNEQPPSEAVEVTLRAETRLHVGDPLTSNLNHDRLGSMKGVVTQEWVRELGRYLSTGSRQHCEVQSVREEELTKALMAGYPTWVSDPDALTPIKQADNSLAVMPVPGAAPCGLEGKVGSIYLPENMEVDSREIFNRWETLASIVCWVHIDWSKLKALDILGLAHHTEVVTR